jgi:hypothetical protein
VICFVPPEPITRQVVYDTWNGLVQDRLRALGVGVLYRVRERAKALIKLAETGLQCLSIPDLFHLIDDLVKSSSLVIFRRLRQAQQVLNQAREGLATCEVSHRGGPEVEPARTWVKTSEAEVKRWQDVRSAYRNHLANLSLVLHPWPLLDSTRQSSPEVECQLQAEITALEAVMKTHGLPVKKTVLDKVRKPLAGVSALVDFWGQMVE